MATINASKTGYIQGGASATFTTAHDATAGTAVYTNPTGGVIPIEYRYQGRRTLEHSFRRAFFYFDTTAVTTTVTAATINLLGSTLGGTAAVIVGKSTAFSGDGSTNLVVGDFDLTTFTPTSYSSLFNSWSTTGNNSITLNAGALADMETYDYFICSVIQYANDWRDLAATSATTLNVAVNYSTTPYLDITGGIPAGGPANIAAFNGILDTNIASVNGIAFTDITSINGIA